MENCIKILLVLGCVLVLCVSCFGVSASSATGTDPVNPNATVEARELLQLFYNIKGKGILTGMYNWGQLADERTELLQTMTGKYPAIWMSDFSYGGFVADGTPWDVPKNRQQMIDVAIKRHEMGEIVSIMWHMVRPTMPETAGFEPGVNGVYDEITFRKALTPGTPEYTALLKRMDEGAKYLKQLQERNIPVLWRPFHEATVGFWWGRYPDLHAELWRLMYDRYTNYHKLNNLLWVWSPNASYNGLTYYEILPFYPGNQYVDIIGVDIYKGNFHQDIYDDMERFAQGKPIGITECGPLPDMDDIFENQPNWTFFCQWADWISPDRVEDANSEETLYKVYNHPYSINRGEIPEDLPDVNGPGILPDLELESVMEVTEVTTSSITVKWEEFAPGTHHYKVLWETGKSKIVYSYDGGMTTITGLTPNTEYTIAVQALRADNSLINLTRLPVTTKPPQTPYMTLMPGTNQMTIELSNVSEQLSYQLTTYHIKNGIETKIYEDTFTGTIWTKTGLGHVESYRFVVTSPDGAFASLEGIRATSGSKIVDATPNSVTIQWNHFDNRAYLYKVICNEKMQDCVINKYGVAEYQITGLSPGTGYAVKIQAVGGESTGWYWLDNLAFNVTTKTVQSIDAEENTIEVCIFDALSTAKNHVEVYEINGTSEVLILDEDFTGQNYLVENLKSVQEYKVVVTSKTGAFLEFSQIVKTKGIKVVAVGHDFVELEWAEVPYSNGFFRQTISSTNPDALGTMTDYDAQWISATTKRFENLSPESTYTFTLQAGSDDENWRYGWQNYEITVKTEQKPDFPGYGIDRLNVRTSATTVYFTHGTVALPETARVLFAAYDQDGRLVSTQSKAFPKPNRTQTFVHPEDMAYFKVYVWDMATMRPVCDSVLHELS